MIPLLLLKLDLSLLQLVPTVPKPDTWLPPTAAVAEGTEAEGALPAAVCEHEELLIRGHRSKPLFPCVSVFVTRSVLCSGLPTYVHCSHDLNQEVRS